MAMLGRFVFSQNLRKCISLSRGNAIRCISTSKKNSDTTTIENPTSTVCDTQTSTQTKNWMSYGFSKIDQADDTDQMNALFFFSITVAFVFGGVLLAYRPDELLRDWSQREGFLELRRREAAGLPLIDPNYIPIENIVLPSDEELGDAEIII